MARAVELLTAVAMPDPRRHLRQHPHELSGGMLQRVMIAAALATEPRAAAVRRADDRSGCDHAGGDPRDPVRAAGRARASGCCSSPTTSTSPRRSATASTSCTPVGSSRAPPADALFDRAASPVHRRSARPPRRTWTAATNGCCRSRAQSARACSRTRPGARSPRAAPYAEPSACLTTRPVLEPTNGAAVARSRACAPSGGRALAGRRAEQGVRMSALLEAATWPRRTARRRQTRPGGAGLSFRLEPGGSTGPGR